MDVSEIIGKFDPKVKFNEPPEGAFDESIQFYDENADLDDERWVNRTFLAHKNMNTKQRTIPSFTTNEDQKIIVNENENHQQQQQQQQQQNLISTTNINSTKIIIKEEQEEQEKKKEEENNDKQKKIKGETPEQRVEREKKEKEKAIEKELRKKRKTDAVLSCPCCFSILCYDCQQHAFYTNQYRAMFVTNNCIVDKNQLFRHKKSGKLSTILYHPVKCATCSTEIAVMEKEDEIFHFFNIIPGN